LLQNQIKNQMLKHFLLVVVFCLVGTRAFGNEQSEVRNCHFELEDPTTAVEILQWRSVADPRPQIGAEPASPPLKVEVQIVLGNEARIEAIRFKQEPPISIRRAIEVAIKSWVLAQDDDKGRPIVSAVVNRQYWFAHCSYGKEASRVFFNNPAVAQFPTDSSRAGLYGSATVFGAYNDEGEIIFSDISKPKMPTDLRQTALDHFSKNKINPSLAKNTLRPAFQRFTFIFEPADTPPSRSDRELKLSNENFKANLQRLTANFDNPLTIYFLEPPQMSVRGYERGLHGKVEFDFTIDKFGHVAEFIAVSAPDALLVQLTLDAVRRWSFKPLTKNGQPVAVRLRAAFEFPKFR
jgi:TonB family protein